MPESFKPYDPNKSWIEWKLDPEEIKEKLLSLIPYRNTLEYFHNNPNAPISETMTMAAHETPILGSLLAGEPTDAAKEAILFGFPVGPKYINDIQSLSNKGYRFRVSEPTARTPGNRYTMDDGEIYAYKPDKNGRVSKSMLLRPRDVSKYKQEGTNFNAVNKGKPVERGYYAWYRDPIKSNYKDISGNELLKLIDESNKVHETVPSLLSRILI